ncbi:c-type cytochrome [Mycoplana ramosa]|uniref:C-type cytochrome n=1 Tax=Mycoplana ramosa TaxID=40837 RepID=A0ABW3YU15_MYCRA
MRYVLILLPILIGLAIPAAFSQSLTSKAQLDSSDWNVGKEVYESSCAACHAPSNIMVSSPKLRDRVQWERRLKAGFETVLQRAMDGFNAMPAKGACEDCSEEEIEAAIRYMASPALGGKLAE